MILDKFKNAKFRSSYGFNFLVIIGLFVFAVVIDFAFAYIEFFFSEPSSDGIGFPSVICAILSMQVTAIAFIIGLIIYIFERLLNISIRSEKFLNLKIVLIIQILSLISMAIPFIYIGTIFLLAVIDKYL